MRGVTGGIQHALQRKDLRGARIGGVRKERGWRKEKREKGEGLEKERREKRDAGERRGGSK